MSKQCCGTCANWWLVSGARVCFYHYRNWGIKSEITRRVSLMGYNDGTECTGYQKRIES